MKLSIVTSVLNVEKDIKQTLDSIIPCLSDDIEWVFVDGGSTDKTVQVVSKQFPHVHVVTGTNLYQGFNSGLDRAQGDYILYLNAGDLFIPDRGLDLLLTSLGETDIYSFTAIFPDGTTFPPKDFNITPLRMPFSHQGCVIRRTLMNELGGFDPFIGPTADHELILKCFLHVATHTSLPQVKLVQCFPAGATEDFVGRTLNRWRNTRNVYKKYRPLEVSRIDTLYKELLLTGLQ